MEKGSLGTKYTDRTNPMDKHVTTMLEMREMTAAPMAPQMFGNAGLEHMEKYGACGVHTPPLLRLHHRLSPVHFGCCTHTPPLPG